VTKRGSGPKRGTLETFVDIVDLVVPELQRRGVYKLDYMPGTLREKLFGPGQAHLPSNVRRHGSAQPQAVTETR